MTEPEKKILLLGATFGTDNMGVGALTAGALTVLTRKYPDANIFFLDYGKEPTTAVTEIEGKKISVALINLRFSWKVFLPNNVAYLLLVSLMLKFISNNLREKLIRNNQWLRAICGADLAVAVSGGDSFSDIYGLSRFFYVALPQLLVTILGNKLVLLPQTIGPFRGSLSKLVARLIINHAAFVFSRDYASVHEARTLLKLKTDDPKVRFCYDLGFVVEPHRPRDIDLGGLKLSRVGKKLLVGLNISGLLFIGGYNQNNMFHLGVSYQELIDRIMAFLIEIKDANILLVPHVFGQHVESDTIAVDSIYMRLKNKYPEHLFCVRGIYNQNEIKYIIGLCDFFIGSRMHACIAALSQSIPAIGIAYSLKFLGVLDSIGVGNLVADSRKLTIEEMLDVLDNALKERNSIKKHLQKAMPFVKEKALNLMTEV